MTLDNNRAGAVVRLSLAQIKAVRELIDRGYLADDDTETINQFDDLMSDALDRAREGRPGYHVSESTYPTTLPTTMFELFAQIDWQKFQTYQNWIARRGGPPGMWELLEYIWDVAHSGGYISQKES